MPRRLSLVITGVALVLAAACQNSGPASDVGAPATVPTAPNAQVAAATQIQLPPPAARADYQLGGAYPPVRGVRLVSRDRTARPLTGAYNICYINAYQTQPEETAWWRVHHPGLLLHDSRGREVVDLQWNEVVFDISTPGKRTALLSIIGSWIDGCAAHGFAGVEPDNLDSWTRSHHLLTEAHDIAFARLLTSKAHQRHLAIAQKNSAELASKGRSLGFDFAVAEECQLYSECGAYTAAYGARVIEVEYTDNGRAAFRAACAHRAGKMSILLRDRDLVRPGQPGYTYSAC